MSLAGLTYLGWELGVTRTFYDGNLNIFKTKCWIIWGGFPIQVLIPEKAITCSLLLIKHPLKFSALFFDA